MIKLFTQLPCIFAHLCISCAHSNKICFDITYASNSTAQCMVAKVASYFISVYVLAIMHHEGKFEGYVTNFATTRRDYVVVTKKLLFWLHQ